MPPIHGKRERAEHGSLITGVKWGQCSGRFAKCVLRSLALYRGASEICASSESIGLRIAFLVRHSIMVTARVYYQKKKSNYTQVVRIGIVLIPEAVVVWRAPNSLLPSYSPSRFLARFSYRSAVRR